MINHHQNHHRQRGVATLVAALTILFTLTLVTLLSARVHILDEKMSSNQYHYKQAFSAAQAGVDDIAARLAASPALIDTKTLNARYPATNLERDANFTPDSADVTSGVAAKYSAYATVVELRVDAASGVTIPIIKMISTGSVVRRDAGTDTATAESTAYISQEIATTSLIGANSKAPFVIANALDLTGGMTIVGNPNALDGANNSVPLAIWSPDAVDISGTFNTCGNDEYFSSGSAYYIDPVTEFAVSIPNQNLFNAYSTDPPLVEQCDDCSCPDSPKPNYSDSADGAGYDVSQSDPSFPTDDELFQSIFGTTIDKYADIRDPLKSKDPIQYLDNPGNNCDTLLTALTNNAAFTGGVVWIDGDCSLASGSAGTALKPILLVIDGGQFYIHASGKFFGLLFIFDHTGAGGASIKTTGGIGYGAMIAASGTDPTAGNFDLIYDAGLLTTLRALDANKVMSAVPGTWKDFE